MNADEKWMQRALELAQRGAGYVHPNPMVGAVVVRKGRMVSEGFHERFGDAHAEVNALDHAGGRAKGATLYVNLEPCSHWGKTPPCIDAILRSGVREVVAAMKDPNPKIAGRGIEALRRKGIRVRTGIAEAAAQHLNRAFQTYMVLRRPFVTLKAASSIDGKIATVTGESKWITGEPARRYAHMLRSQVDAIAVGVQTVLRDNPTLTSHGQGPSPLRVVFDSHLRTPVHSHVISNRAATLFITAETTSERKRKLFIKSSAEVDAVRRRANGLDIGQAMNVLFTRGITHLLVEGGGRLAASFLEEGVVDEILWFIAPIIIGGAQARTAVEGAGVRRLAKAWRLNRWKVEQLGDDLCIHGSLRR